MYFCGDENRRADILAHPTLNGIDYVEVGPDHKRLNVYFLKSVPLNGWGLVSDPSRVSVAGGTRVVGIRVRGVTRHADHLEIEVDRGGDFSQYELSIIGVPELDVRLSSVSFTFMAACPVDFDCPHDPPCAPVVAEEPSLDYMAKDYASFRRLLLDLVAQRNPRFRERNPADLGIAILELLAYSGDQLSYFQDAVANEAFLDTLRHRISARRHAKLVDYRVHDGRNAWTFVHLSVTGPNVLKTGTKLATRIASVLRGAAAPPGAVLATGTLTPETLREDPALAGAQVFETTHTASFDPLNNELFLHTWGDDECCLVEGATEAYVYTRQPGMALAARPVLRKGDYVLFEEVRDPLNGRTADASPAHRQVVRLIEDPINGEDPAYRDTLRAVPDANPQEPQQWELEAIAGPAGTPAQPVLPLVRIRWGREDALRFPVCVSTRPVDRGPVRNVSVARGNIVVADNGLTVRETLATPIANGLVLRETPLTLQGGSDDVEFDFASAIQVGERPDVTADVREAKPAVGLRIERDGGRIEQWRPAPDLLDSPPFDERFVAEVDDDGRAHLRFGDGEYGKELDSPVSAVALYRVGNGRAGNVGAESIVHIEIQGGSGWIDTVRNVTAASDGVDAETIDEVRVRAPRAFKAAQIRAVTEGDYANAVRAMPEVQGAVATFRWTGTWYTVFIGVDPRDPADLVNEADGGQRLSRRLERLVRAELARRRLAGYDLEIRAPRFVPLELELEICVAEGHFRADVLQAVRAELGTRVLPDGRKPFFHPDNFSFGEPVYLSRIYRAAELVQGVESVAVRIFRRFGRDDAADIERGAIGVEQWEVAQLENDPNFMERGVLRVKADGGKG